jgi:hypothetical protein
MAGTVTVHAGFGSCDRYLFCGTAVGFLKIDLERGLKISTLFTPGPTRPAPAATEELITQVPHVKAATTVERISGTATTTASGCAVFLGLFEAIVSHLVVLPAFLLVSEYFLGFLYFLELFFGVGLVAHIRMVFPGFLAVGLRNLIFGGIP